MKKLHTTFLQANSFKATGESERVTSRDNGSLKWTPPAPRLYRKVLEWMGFGVVCRNWNGKVMFAGMRMTPKQNQVERADSPSPLWVRGLDQDECPMHCC